MPNVMIRDDYDEYLVDWIQRVEGGRLQEPTSPYCDCNAGAVYIPYDPEKVYVFDVEYPMET